MEQAQSTPQSDSLGTDVTGDDLPDWLTASVSTQSTQFEPVERTKEQINQDKRTAKQLLHLQYENMFENFIEQIYRGQSLRSLVVDDPRLISYEDFLRWIKRDPQRHERFKEAQEMRTEFLAGEILEIADGVDSVEPTSNDTVNRDKLRIDTRKWLMGAHNKKRYGESKQIEVGGTISITEALAQAQARMIQTEIQTEIEAEIVDVTPRLESD